jgi:hypothetical protein
MERGYRRRAERGTDRRVSSAHEVFVFVLVKEGTLMNAMQIGTWQLWSSYEELRI